MKFIDNKLLFYKKLSEIDSLVARGSRLPENVFVNGFANYLFLRFDDVLTDVFFEKIQSFLVAEGGPDVTLAVIDPDPESYFFEHFGRYPVIEFSTGSSPKEYLAAITDDPGGSPADAIIYNSEVLVLYALGLRWVIYADRNFELAIIGFRASQVRDTFLSVFGKERALNVDGAIDAILDQVFGGGSKDVVDQIVDRLREVYAETDQVF